MSSRATSRNKGVVERRKPRRNRGVSGGNLRNTTDLSAERVASRVAELGQQITQDYKESRLDVVVILNRGFVFAADLIRQIGTPVVCHFVREVVRDVEHGGWPRREVTFETQPDLRGRDVLLVDAVIDSGVTQEFLLRRLGEQQPHSLRLAVLLDKAQRRRVNLEPDYFGFRTASNDMWVGYGLAGTNGTGGNASSLSSRAVGAKRIIRNKK